MQGQFQNLLTATLDLGDLGITVGLVISVIVKIMIILTLLVLTVAYLTYFERKVIGFIQFRVGPNVAGPWDLIQPLADVFELLSKEVTCSKLSNRALFYIGPIISLAPSFAVRAMILPNEEWVLININIDLLYILVITSLPVYGVVVAGWASNSKYSLLGAMRTFTQNISYEIIMSAALMRVVVVSGGMNFPDIVTAQAKGIVGGSVFSWDWLPLFPTFIVYSISVVAETNHVPLDVAEGESEIVAGHHAKYSGSAFALSSPVKYIFVVPTTTLTSLMFLSGWLSPFPQNWGFIDAPSAFQMFVKMAAVLYWYLWIHAISPYYHYDQIMRLGWEVLIPIGFVYIVILGVWMTSSLNLQK